MEAARDPVRARRLRVARLAAAGRATGFALFGVALLVVILGFLTTLTTAVVTVASVCLVAGSVLLAPAIIAGYGVRAAERDDRAGR